MSMKLSILLFGAISVLMAGCSHTLPPHQEMNQALQKTLGSSGYNYTSKSKITNLVLPVKDLKPALPKQQYLKKGLEVARGLSIITDGAVDMKTQKSEVLYTIHYDQNNVEVSIKMPLLMDYSKQTLYVGTTVLNTIFPLAADSKGKLIKIDLNDVLRLAGDKSETFKNMLNKKNLDSVNEAFKKGVLTFFADLKDDRFNDRPLTDDDKAAGVVRRIDVKLGHDESVALFFTIADTFIQRFYQDGLLTKKEYDSLMALTDKQKINTYFTEFTLDVMLNVGLESTGRISRIESRFTAVGKDGRYQVGLENISGFSRYDAPLFFMKPELTGTVDFKEMFDAIMAARAADKAAEAARKATPADPEASKGDKQITD